LGEKNYLLTKFQSDSSKILADEPSSQHREAYVAGSAEIGEVRKDNRILPKQE
jgi:hypothetical protein